MKKTISLFIVMLLTACSQIDNHGISDTTTQESAYTTIIEGNTCLLPYIDFAYTNSEGGYLTEYEERILLPQKPWKSVIVLDDDPFHLDGNSLESQFIRRKDGHDEFWINLGTKKGIVVYNLDMGNIQPLMQGNELLNDIVLFLDRNNEIWAYGSDYRTIILYKLDTEKYQFIPIYDKSGIFKKGIEESYISELKVDQNGIFWMTVVSNAFHKNYLLSYDPATSMAAFHLTELDIWDTIAISPENIIYLVEKSGDLIIAYDSQSKKYEKINFWAGSTVFSLYHDKMNRLWIGQEGFFDLNHKLFDEPIWYDLIGSPIFLSYIDGQGLWLWTNPVFTHDNPPNILWYYSFNGSGWVDTETGTWCIFTTEKGIVLPDSKDNLWIFASGTLYKLEKSKIK